MLERQLTRERLVCRRRANVVLPNDPDLVDILAKNGVDISVAEGDQQGNYVSLLSNLLFPLLAFGGLFFLFNRAQVQPTAPPLASAVASARRNGLFVPFRVGNSERALIRLTLELDRAARGVGVGTLSAGGRWISASQRASSRRCRRLALSSPMSRCASCPW